MSENPGWKASPIRVMDRTERIRKPKKIRMCSMPATAYLGCRDWPKPTISSFVRRVPRWSKRGSGAPRRSRPNLFHMMKLKAPNERMSRTSWRAGPESPRYVCAAGAGAIYQNSISGLGLLAQDSRRTGVGKRLPAWVAVWPTSLPAPRPAAIHTVNADGSGHATLIPAGKKTAVDPDWRP